MARRRTTRRRAGRIAFLRWDYPDQVLRVCSQPVASQPLTGTPGDAARMIVGARASNGERRPGSGWRAGREMDAEGRALQRLRLDLQLRPVIVQHHLDERQAQ